MATRYAIRHIGTRSWLSVRPSLGRGLMTSASEAGAASYSTMTEAELERASLADFATAWEVVPIAVASIYDDPQETAPLRDGT